MAKERGLGRGFDSLIPTEVTADMPAAVRPPAGDAIIQVDPARIVPNPHQPRTNFDQEELAGLADSIKQHGILHPPVVSELADGRYELIAGERRWRAAKLAGLATVPVIVRSYDDQQKLELALLENIQRSELNPIETAAAYRKLMDEFNLSLDALATRLGKAKSTVANLMRLLTLPADALAAVASGKISEAHGRAILAAADPAVQAELLRHITADGWTVRQAEAFARDYKQSSPAPGGSTASPTQRQAASVAQTQLAEQLGTYLRAPVVLQSTAKGGRLVIAYDSDAELLRLVKAIKHNSADD
jgi:ParB family chromosome partitioning protein